MKRVLCLALTVLMLVLSLSACTGSGNNNTQPNYSALNDMMKAAYSGIVVNVSSTLNGETLKDKYILTQIGDLSVVQYSCQRRSLFSEDGIPDSYYTTYEGDLEIRNGQIISLNGDMAVIDFTPLTVAAFTFNKSFFDDVKMQNKGFSAKVTDPRGFFGSSDVDVTDMTITAEYAQRFTSLTLSYTSTEGATVAISYTFA